MGPARTRIRYLFDISVRVCAERTTTRLAGRTTESLMARVTVEDCLDQVANRFALVVLASERSRQLARGAAPLVECNNKVSVTALREIAQGDVYFQENVRDTVMVFIQERRAAGFM